MSRSTPSILSTFVILLAASVICAVPATAEQRIISGVFADDTGASISFQVPVGKTLKVTNRDTGVTYGLAPQVVGPDRVRITVFEGVAQEEVDRFELRLGSKPRSGVFVPFSLAVTRITVERDARRGEAAIEAATAGGGVRALAECCINCGPWKVCCEPSEGWCCRLTCVGSGETCEACTAQQ